MKNTPILGKWNYIFLLGESGGGKGTLVNNIRKYWLPNLESRSMGDIFREKAKEDEEIRRLTEEGTLIDDSIAFKMFSDVALSNSPGLIDGFPRNRSQALEAIKFIKSQHWRVLVIDIQCDIEVIIERLLHRGRQDDKLSIMYKRNQTHKLHHPSVMEEINNRRDLFDIITLNGNLQSDIVFTNFAHDVLRLVDLLYLYDISLQPSQFIVNNDETTVNPALNRFICDMLRRIHDKIESEYK